MIYCMDTHAGMPEKCILLKNKPGHRYTSRSSSLTRDSVLKGTLLVELTEGEAKESLQFVTTPLNYKKYSNNVVKLYCEPEHVCQLTDKQFNLLLAVKSTFDCHKALDILHWVEKLRVGDDVNVTISFNLEPVRGVIRYIGSLHGEEGTMFGVELLVSIYLLCYFLLTVFGKIWRDKIFANGFLFNNLANFSLQNFSMYSVN